MIEIRVWLLAEEFPPTRSNWLQIYSLKLSRGASRSLAVTAVTQRKQFFWMNAGHPSCLRVDIN